MLAAVNVPKGYLNIDSGVIDFSGPLQWILLFVVFGGALHFTYWLVTKKRKERRRRRTPHKSFRSGPNISDSYCRRHVRRSASPAGWRQSRR